MYVRLRRYAPLVFSAALLHGATIPGRVYSYDIAAATGQIPVNAPSPLIGMGDNPSVNANGNVAFVGRFAEGEGIVVASGATSQLITPGFVSATRSFGRAVQINDANQVMANDRVTGNPPLYFERLWNAGATNSFATVARGGPSSSYDAVFNQGSTNRSGDSVFGALRGSQILLVSVSGGVAREIPLPANSLPRPLIADNQNIVIRFGNLVNSPILMYGIDLKAPIAAIAGSSSFDALGNQPGISHDGKIVSFYGVPNSLEAGVVGAGEGVFASVDIGGGTRQRVRVAGGAVFQSFRQDTDSRIGVTHLDLGPPGIEGDTFVVSFLADDMSGQSGLWTVRVDVTGSRAKGDLGFSVKAAALVAKVGDTISGATILGISVFDPIAETTSGIAGDHQVVFWAQASTGVVIIRATFCLVTALDPITDLDAKRFERSNSPLCKPGECLGKEIDTDNIRPTLKSALSCFENLVTDAKQGGGAFTLTSAYRPPAYQSHLRNVFDKHRELQKNTDPACQGLKMEVDDEFGPRVRGVCTGGHCLKRQPVLRSDHTGGSRRCSGAAGCAFDATIVLPITRDVDDLADQCGLRRPEPDTDEVHFILKSLR